VAGTGGGYGNVRGNSSKTRKRRALHDRWLTKVRFVPFAGDEDGRKVGFHCGVGGGGLELWAAVRFGMPGGFVDETR